MPLGEIRSVSERHFHGERGESGREGEAVCTCWLVRLLLLQGMAMSDR